MRNDRGDYGQKGGIDCLSRARQCAYQCHVLFSIIGILRLLGYDEGCETVKGFYPCQGLAVLPATLIA
jgi:hypothetical protein